jgi:hypothetical protein
MCHRRVTCCPAWAANYLTFVVAPCMTTGAHCDLGRTLSPSSNYSVAFSVMSTLVALPPHKIGSRSMQRNRFTQTTTLGDRLAHEAERLRQNARTVPVGQQREEPFAESSPVRDRLAHQRMAIVSGPANAAVRCTAPGLPQTCIYLLRERSSRSRAIRRLI